MDAPKSKGFAQTLAAASKGQDRKPAAPSTSVAAPPGALLPVPGNPQPPPLLVALPLVIAANMATPDAAAVQVAAVGGAAAAAGAALAGAELGGVASVSNAKSASLVPLDAADSAAAAAIRNAGGANSAARQADGARADASVRAALSRIGNAAPLGGKGAAATGNALNASGEALSSTGSAATATGNDASATGSAATAMGSAATAMGSAATAMGSAATAMGSDATTTGNAAAVAGNAAIAGGEAASAGAARAAAEASGVAPASALESAATQSESNASDSGVAVIARQNPGAGDKHGHDGANSPSTGTSALGDGSVAAGQASAGAAAATSGNVNSSTAPRLTAGLTTPEFPQQLADHLSYMVDQNLNGATLQVNPPQLGPIELRVSVESGHAQVWLSAHNAAAFDALQSSSPKLREMLASQGFGQVSVDVSQRSFQDRAPYRQPYQSAPDLGPGVLVMPAAPSLTWSPRASSGLLDAYA